MTTLHPPRRTVPAPLLADLGDPADLRKLPADRLPELAAQIRGFLVDRVSLTGGHLGPNLGVVELTIALHRVFDSPRDALVFDTGHQTYVHKLLTGRRDDFGTLRQAGGLSGYPSRTESAHDLVENSHASTALSHAHGLARAFTLRGRTGRHVVAVVGDGALTGGMAWEALNNLGASPHLPVVVVLNDNGRSYAPTVGGLAVHLAALRSGGRRTDRNLFTDLGLGYLGPVDGHDTAALERALEQARSAARPVVVHVVTVKGRGYPPAERNEEDHLHAVPVIDPRTAEPVKAPGTSWTSVLSRTLLELAAEHPDLVALTAAMPGPTGLDAFRDRHPDRFLDVGIAEQHAVATAAGLAAGGAHPVVALYATFLSRAFDQVLMDVALHRLPVTLVLDRAGITGPDGPSHHGMWDLTLLGAVPGMRVAVPRDAAQLRRLLAEAVAHAAGPTAVRFPKAAVGADIPALERHGPVDLLRRSAVGDVLLVAAGPLAAPALEAAARLAAEGVGVTVADPRWVLPVPAELVDLALRHRLVVTVEDNTRHGGLGTAVARALADAGSGVPVRILGLPGCFVPHGTRTELLARSGLDAPGIARAVLEALAGRPAHRSAHREA